MPIPDKAALMNFAAKYVELWNKHDLEAWTENWRQVAPGDFRMLDPVGTPEKHGFDACAKEPWNLFNARVRFKHHNDIIFVNGNELAWVLENQITTDDKTFIGKSIETFRFEEDGSVTIRTWYDVPERKPTELGDMFQTYLPE
ncbi:MAG: nuclear transport factor 2 family protein [Candidatus Binatia bacterium]|nr:nuclear transport factor 2 family protein [Candidatus Binatia bacterium]MDG2009816.1 nuclear transport factor 2 family protein [Candidatus Binatia bacterium]HAC80826.1 hypothetical protein [Deltaproteobacteria bacterium]